MDLKITQSELSTVIPIIVGTISFVTVWFVGKSSRLELMLTKSYLKESNNAAFILFNKWFGGLILGLVPACVYLWLVEGSQLADLGLTFKMSITGYWFLWLVVLIVAVVFSVINNAKKTETLENYPQIRAKKWNRKLIALHLLGWTVYLLGYEFFFRGVLFFPLVESIGLWPAIAVNISLYSSTHIPKGLNETIGAIPLAIVLCLFTLSTQSIWVAFIVHIIIAWTNFLVSFKYNKNMRLY